ncbi:hypothetical protein HW49_05155 [Porphyromonadaceae bacterium COT-184 OH4590]|nr:hypothetical protein HW49_05155 [Porphyromonadaceae bacterium COT-184 OH4590]
MHNAFKCIIVEAQRRKLCEYNPYDDFKIKRGQSRPPVYLMESEVRKIMDFSPSIDRLQKVKDLFIFQCYTGLAYADMMNFRRQSVVEIEGRKAISSNRKKTEQTAPN